MKKIIKRKDQKSMKVEGENNRENQWNSLDMKLNKRVWVYLCIAFR